MPHVRRRNAKAASGIVSLCSGWLKATPRRSVANALASIGHRQTAPAPRASCVRRQCLLTQLAIGVYRRSRPCRRTARQSGSSAVMTGEYTFIGLQRLQLRVGLPCSGFSTTLVSCVFFAAYHQPHAQRRSDWRPAWSPPDATWPRRAWHQQGRRLAHLLYVSATAPHRFASMFEIDAV